MAKVSFVLDQRTQNKFGQSPVKIQITNRNTMTQISTGIFVRAKDFTDNPNFPIGRHVLGAKEITAQLQAAANKYIETVFDLHERGRLDSMTAAEIRQYAERKRQQVPSRNFSETLQYYIDNHCTTEKTKGTYLYTQQKLNVYTGNAIMEFEDIDYQFLLEFKDWMTDNELGVNTRSIVFRCMRAIYNYGVKTRIAKRDENPFTNDFTIESATKEIDYLPLHVWKKLLTADLKGGQAMARDFFLLSFYLCGVNPVDLYNMEPANKKEVTYVRQKIANSKPQPCHIRIHPAAQAIIDKYRGDKKLLSFFETYSSYNVFKRFMSREIHEAGEAIQYPRLYFYQARYSWATYAVNVGVSELVIDKALGHKPRGLVGQRYAYVSWDMVNRANKDVIDFALGQ